MNTHYHVTRTVYGTSFAVFEQGRNMGARGPTSAKVTTMSGVTRSPPTTILKRPMGQALYRTYRSKKLGEVVGQEHITTALEHALKQGTISHAYLFTGPRGVGKTSIARILAHEINGLPYDENRPHLDIIEIDAASNRRIDEIRDLREKVHLAPTSATYKVYIIDEVHMLTKEAFNALLKTLEEPPAHVVFILATTEAHKLPETIISRTQRYTFKPIDQDKVIAHLKHIAQSENIDITDEALALVAAHGEGSFRDSISLLDQVRNTKGKVELTDVQAVLGIAPAELIDRLLQALPRHDSITIARTLNQLHNQGYAAAQVAKQLGSRLRHQLLEGQRTLPAGTLLTLLSALVQVPASPDPRLALEISLLDAALSGEAPAQTSPMPKTPPEKTMPEEITSNLVLEVHPKRTPKVEPTAHHPQIKQKGPEEKRIAPTEIKTGALLSNESWELVLNALRQKHNTLYSIAKTAQAHFEPGLLTLECNFAFYQKRLNDASNKQALLTIIHDVTGSEVQLRCVVGAGKPAPAPAPSLPPADGEIVHNVAPQTTFNAPAAATHTASSESIGQPSSDPIATISNIFGGAELLES